jgi:PAS domain-containing protein
MDDERPAPSVPSGEESPPREATPSLESHNLLLQCVIDSVRDLIFVKDRGGRFVLTNHALDEGCGRMFGLQTTDFFGEDMTRIYEGAARIACSIR